VVENEANNNTPPSLPFAGEESWLKAKRPIRSFFIDYIGGAGENCTPVQKFFSNTSTSLDRFKISLKP